MKLLDPADIKSKLNINYIRFGEGLMNRLLHRLWHKIGEIYQAQIAVHVFPNTGALDHATALQLMWMRELRRPERWAVLTEHDFLPSIKAIQRARLGAAHSDIGLVWTPYFIRDSRPPFPLIKTEYTTPWFLLIDKEKVQHLDFSPGGEYNDPGNLLLDYLRENYPLVETGHIFCRDGLKNRKTPHFGVDTSAGTHLYWSRHYNDPPDTELMPDLTVKMVLSGVIRRTATWAAYNHEELLRVVEEEGNCA